MEKFDKRILAIACKFAPSCYNIKSIDNAGIAEIVPNKRGEKFRLTKERFHTANQPIPDQLDQYIVANYEEFLSQLQSAYRFVPSSVRFS